VRLEGPGERLTIFIEETDQHGHQPVYTEIVQRARRAGLAGASVFRGLEGFGATSRLHQLHALSLEEDVPVVIVIVDEPERIEAFVPELDDLVSHGLVVREPVHVVRYEGGGRR
jgi:PII-like signaling protein